MKTTYIIQFVGGDVIIGDARLIWVSDDGGMMYGLLEVYSVTMRATKL